MTEDGRFLVFNYTRGNERRKDVGPRVTMVADFLKDRVFEIGELQKSPPCVEFPFVESKENYIVYGDLKNGFFRMDFTRPGRGNAVKLCDSPQEFADMNTGPLDLIRSDGKRTMIPAKARNFASHEIWDDDGRGFSWCGNGLDHEIYHHDLASGVQECVMPLPGGRHNTLSPDLKYVVYDNC